MNVRAIINPGDLFASLPALKKCCEITGEKINLFLWLNRKATYFEGAKHPTQDENGLQVTMNEKVFDAVKPLLLAQDYIADVRQWNGEEFRFALDEHLHFNINKWFVNLSRLFFYIFPDLSCDLSQPWIEVPEGRSEIAKGKILIARTERYLNPSISYHFLREFQDDILFVGLEHERDIFCKEYGLNIDWVETKDFLQVAQAIKQCKFLMSNQTAVYQLAEAQKTPRILEVSHGCPNVQPIGANGYDFMYQTGLDFYFKLLNK